jgi:two-component system response regulator ArlR
MKILIIEDEYSLADAIAEVLKKENFTTNIITDGEEGENEALTNLYDLILLDIMLPNKDGFKILNDLRKEKVDTPIIILTAKSEINDKLNGLENGADDYITKPFHIKELVARVKVVLKRKVNIENTDILEYDDLKLDIRTGKMSANGNIENVDNIQERKIFDVSKETEMTISMFESMAYERNVKLSSKIQENIMINGNKEDIEHILSTLIDNAIKHTESGNEVIVELSKEKNELIIQVKNEGKEIPEKEREKIFERFYRIDKSRNRNEKRYGLGLAIAKSTVKKYNGNIKVLYKDGFTIFKVNLQIQ